MTIRRLSRAESLDRELINKLALGQKIPIARVSAMTKRTTKLFDRKLLKQGWRLRRVNRTEIEVIAKIEKTEVTEEVPVRERVRCKDCIHFSLADYVFLGSDGWTKKGYSPRCKLAPGEEMDLETTRGCTNG